MTKITSFLLKLVVKLYVKVNKDGYGVVTVVLNALDFKDYVQQSMLDEDVTGFFNKDYTEFIQMIYTDNPDTIMEWRNELVE